MLGHDTVVNADAGSSWLDFSDFSGPVNLNLALGGTAGHQPGLLTLTLDDGSGSMTDQAGIANVQASAYPSSIVGNRRSNAIYGSGGPDTLMGGSGADDAQGFDLLAARAPQYVYLDFDTYTPADGSKIIYTQAERDQIQADISADYGAFNYIVTQDRSVVTSFHGAPTLGRYFTIDFNNASGDNPTVAGLASELDFRHLNLTGHSGHRHQRLRQRRP